MVVEAVVGTNVVRDKITENYRVLVDSKCDILQLVY